MDIMADVSFNITSKGLQKQPISTTQVLFGGSGVNGRILT